MTAQTPRERGAEALVGYKGLTSDPAQYRRWQADAVLTAALTDPTDPDALAKVLCVSNGNLWEALYEDGKAVYRTIAAGVRAWLLSEGETT